MLTHTETPATTLDVASFQTYAEGKAERPDAVSDSDVDRFITIEDGQQDRLLRRASDGPNQLWVADMTYVPTWAGFIYLAVVLDVWSRRIVGWAIGEQMSAELVLVLAAPNMALQQRRPDGVIHHSDQGSQYTSIAFGERCKKMGVRPSMGTVGDAYDNAMAESFFATLECELIDRRSWQTKTEARGWRYSPTSKVGATRAVAIAHSARLHGSSSIRLENQVPTRPRYRVKSKSKARLRIHTRNGTTNLFVAVEPKAGHCVVSFTEHRGKVDFVAFIGELLTNASAKARRGHLVLDSYRLRTKRRAGLVTKPARAPQLKAIDQQPGSLLDVAKGAVPDVA